MHFQGRQISQIEFAFFQQMNLQYNLDGSNTDGSFTVDDSNSFLSP